MRRTLRILLATLTLLSLLLCIASAIFWIRSHRGRDTLTLTPLPSRWSLSTSSGTLRLTHDLSYIDPAEVKSVISSFKHERSLLGFGVKQSEEFHSWPVTSRGPFSSITYGTVTKTHYMPLWACLVLLGILPTIQYSRLARRLRRRRRGLCLNCGYDLRASPAKCPECGTAVFKKQNKNVPLPKPR
jgi:hypothetical protein